MTPEMALQTTEQIWVDLVEPSEAELSASGQLLDVPQRVLQEVHENKGTPRFVPYRDGAMFLLLHRVFYRFDEDISDFRPISFYLSG